MGNQSKQQGSRPLVATLKGQNAKIARLESLVDRLVTEVITLKSQNSHLASLAGVSKEFDAITQRVASFRAEALRKKADEENPANPVPDPPSEAPTETTEEALQPDTNDNVFNLGQTPGSTEDLPADTSTNPLVPGEALPTEPYTEMVDVQAPISGTEEQLPLPQTKTETDVRVGNPDNPEVAFPLNPAFDGGNTAQASVSNSRSLAAMRLARLRIQAGIASGDDIAIAASIEADRTMTPDRINTEIQTLSQVAKAASRRGQARPAGLVPRAAAGVQRTVPSLAGDSGLPPVVATTMVADEVGDADLFLGDW